MSQAEQFSAFVAELKEESNNRMPDYPKLIVDNTTGGTDNWLLNLAEETQFFVVDKLERQNFLLLRMELLRKDPENLYCVLWAYPTAAGPEGTDFGTVHPQRFVNRFELIKVIPKPPVEQKQE